MKQIKTQYNILYVKLSWRVSRRGSVLLEHLPRTKFIISVTKGKDIITYCQKLTISQNEKIFVVRQKLVKNSFCFFFSRTTGVLLKIIKTLKHLKHPKHPSFFLDRRSPQIPSFHLLSLAFPRLCCLLLVLTQVVATTY